MDNIEPVMKLRKKGIFVSQWRSAQSGCDTNLEKLQKAPQKALVRTKVAEDGIVLTDAQVQLLRKKGKEDDVAVVR